MEEHPIVTAVAIFVAWCLKFCIFGIMLLVSKSVLDKYGDDPTMLVLILALLATLDTLVVSYGSSLQQDQNSVE